MDESPLKVHCLLQAGFEKTQTAQGYENTYPGKSLRSHIHPNLNAPPLLSPPPHPPPADPTAASAVSCSLPSPITAYFRHSSYSTLIPSPIRLCASSLCLDSSVFGRRLIDSRRERHEGHFRKGVCGGVQEGAAAEAEAGEEEGEGVGAECRYLHRRTIARSTIRKFRLSPSLSKEWRNDVGGEEEGQEVLRGPDALNWDFSRLCAPIRVLRCPSTLNWDFSQLCAPVQGDRSSHFATDEQAREIAPPILLLVKYVPARVTSPRRSYHRSDATCRLFVGAASPLLTEWSTFQLWHMLLSDRMVNDACWAIVSGEAIESLYNISNRPEILFQTAPQELMNCVKKEKKECYTSSVNEGFRYAEQFGIREEKSCPFKANKQDCQSKLKDTPTLKITGFTNIPELDEDRIIDALKKQPIAAGVLLTQEFKEYKEVRGRS
ncbi:hypothetical protein C3L33_17280, partial [Rhododendron williamsianum]